MRELPLSRGRAVTLLDDEDYDRVTACGPWHLRVQHEAHSVLRYATRVIDGKTTPLHRFILRAPSGLQVDHINHDGLDNRRSNLRLVTTSQNQMNQRKQGRGSSRFKGVYRHSRGNRWVARIGPDRDYLGVFADEIEAALAYDAAALERYGEYARPNFSPVAGGALEVPMSPNVE